VLLVLDAHRAETHVHEATGLEVALRRLLDTGGGLLLVPQFTLAADTGKGLRPSFTGAAPPELGRHLFDSAVAGARRHLGPRVATGQFGAGWPAWSIFLVGAVALGAPVIEIHTGGYADAGDAAALEALQAQVAGEAAATEARLAALLDDGAWADARVPARELRFLTKLFADIDAMAAELEG